MGTGSSVSPLSAGSLAQLTLSLLLIVGLIFAISWVLKRFRIAVPSGRGDLAVVDEVAVGPRERIVLIRVGDAQVLVGVGAGGMVALTPLATPIALKPSAAAPVFADRLRELMRRPGGGT
ncbi:MAG: flagellar biosynthetic protein FliO [Steroidobacteraceae bacterium]|jgi:flagellar protein FliO/FliZ